jgi:hypothetical protein
MAVLGRLKEDLQASALPFRVDVSDWHRLSSEFQALIRNRCEKVI